MSCHVMSFHSILCHSFLLSFMQYVLQFVLPFLQHHQIKSTNQIRSNQIKIKSNRIQWINERMNQSIHQSINQPTKHHPSFELKLAIVWTCMNTVNLFCSYFYKKHLQVYTSWDTFTVDRICLYFLGKVWEGKQKILVHRPLRKTGVSNFGCWPFFLRNVLSPSHLYLNDLCL